MTGAELRLVFNKQQEQTNQVNQLLISELNSDNLGSYDSVRVLVNDVIKPPKKSSIHNHLNHNEPIMFPIDSKFIDLRRRKNESFWITLDVFPAVSRWMANPKKNHGLVVQVLHPNGQIMSQSTLKHIRVRRNAEMDTSSRYFITFFITF